MKNVIHLCLFLMMATSLNVLADKVYKATNEKGTVEFSDKKSPGAEKINVKPNVVDLSKPKMPESKDDKKAPPDGPVQQTEKGVVVHTGTARAGNLQRRIRYNADGEPIKETKKKREKAKKKAPVTIQPVRKGPGQGAGNAAGGRAGGGGR